MEATEVSDARKITQYVKMGCFWFLEAKEAVKVTEASDVIGSVEVIEAIEVFRTTQILKISNTWLELPYLDVLKKDLFRQDSWNVSEILPSLITDAVEDRDVNSNQIKGSQVKIPLLRIPKQPSN